MGHKYFKNFSDPIDILIKYIKLRLEHLYNQDKVVEDIAFNTSTQVWYKAEM